MYVRKRELSTTDPAYVRWTQWIFLQLFKHGLAYQSEASVNWCPELGTVLANEEVINGLSERGNHKVIRQPLRQWMLKITAFADVLNADLATLQWPEGTRSAQYQWIGKSHGVTVQFPLLIPDGVAPKSIDVFTTRLDTLYGVTYLGLAPEYSGLKEIVTPEQAAAVDAYVQEVQSKSDVDRSTSPKSGAFTGAYAMHPLTGEKIPIWVADYVLGEYGTGAVMGVPAHDQRDFDFATVTGIDVKQVVFPFDSKESALPYIGEGVLGNCSAELIGRKSTECKNDILEKLKFMGLGHVKVAYRLRDWIFSRQRYWGEPIPIYYPIKMKSHHTDPRDPDAEYEIQYDQPIPVPEDELPVQLPNMSNFASANDPQGCLAGAIHWRFFQKNGEWFARETNTMPQWAGSCWYYLRFADPTCSDKLLSDETQAWLPVDLYIGGQEHAVLHLLYARFWHKFLHQIGAIKSPEPFTKLVHQGVITGENGEKMSKSLGNVVNPDDVVEKYGADALRLYEMFMGPIEAMKPWQISQIKGVVRFRERVYQLMLREVSHDLPRVVENEMNKTIVKVTADMENLSFNTAISQLMIFSNYLVTCTGPLPKKALETLTLLLAPIAPHVAEECWELLGHKNSLARHPWPVPTRPIDEEPELVKYVVSIDGKKRALMEVSKSTSRSDAIAQAMKLHEIAPKIESERIKDVIYVANRVINIVTERNITTK